MHTGHRVARLRASFGESLRDAAVRTGLSHTTIARIESGQVSAALNSTLLKIAQGYGVSVEFLLDGRETEGDFAAASRLRLLGPETSTSVDPQTLDAYITLLRKAMDKGVQPQMLDLALDLLTVRNGGGARTLSRELV